MKQLIPENGGHATVWGGKGPATSLKLTPEAREIARRECKRTGLSFSDLVETLIRRHASRIGEATREEARAR